MWWWYHNEKWRPEKEDPEEEDPEEEDTEGKDFEEENKDGSSIGSNINPCTWMDV